jgi:hypothetical protein
MDGQPESAGIKRHIVGDEEPYRKGVANPILASSLAGDIARCRLERRQGYRCAGLTITPQCIATWQILRSDLAAEYLQKNLETMGARRRQDLEGKKMTEQLLMREIFSIGSSRTCHEGKAHTKT